MFRLPVKSVSLALLVVLVLFQRVHYSANLFETWNKRSDQVRTLLLAESIDNDTQIALVNIIHVTGGYYIWSSGYIQYLLGNPSIRAIAGPEYNFYNPFNPKQCHYGQRMSCLDPDGKLVAFKKGNDGKPQKMRYFLQWLTPGDDGSKWVLMQTDDQNQLQNIIEGTGTSEYEAALSSLDLASDEVLWGKL
jgi:hypothetical protein